MRYFSSEKARKYVDSKGLQVEYTKGLWKSILDTGRLFPDKGRKFSKASLDKYINEVRPR